MRNRKYLKNKLTLVFLGRSGSGKGTQAEFVMKRLGKKDVSHLETGRFLRKLLKKPNPTVNIARQEMAAGELLPSWLAAYTWLKELVEKGQADKHLIFDGAPRRIWEAKLVDEVMSWHQRSLPVCVYVDVSSKEAMRRLLLRGRRDDKPSAIKNRMNFFDKNVLPVISYYKNKGRLIRINGNPLPDAVRKKVDKTLAKRFGKRWLQ